MDKLEDLRQQVLAFARERNWDEFHSPKNLAMALSVEAAELVEIFQWLTEAQSRDLAPDAKAAAGEEIADVLIYLLQISNQLGIDPIAAAKAKIIVNGRKYPVDKARGSARKLDER